MTIYFHHGDLPEGFDPGPAIAVDSETMGLNPHRDRLCLVQLSTGDGTAHLVRIARGQREAPRLARVLADKAVLKIFHFARFDLAVLWHQLGIETHPVYCTKIAAKLTRTYAERNGLKDVCKELLGIEISKQQQLSDWGADMLTEEQMRYAASDVLHLHALKDKLDALLAREGRANLAQACFAFLPARAKLDLLGWDEPDLFAH